MRHSLTVSSSLEPISVPLQEILKFDYDFNAILDPHSIVSVFPRCRDNLSMRHLLTVSNSLEPISVHLQDILKFEYDFNIC